MWSNLMKSTTSTLSSTLNTALAASHNHHEEEEEYNEEFDDDGEEYDNNNNNNDNNNNNNNNNEPFDGWDEPDIQDDAFLAHDEEENGDDDDDDNNNNNNNGRWPQDSPGSLLFGLRRFVEDVTRTDPHSTPTRHDDNNNDDNNDNNNDHHHHSNDNNHDNHEEEEEEENAWGADEDDLLVDQLEDVIHSVPQPDQQQDLFPTTTTTPTTTMVPPSDAVVPPIDTTTTSGWNDDDINMDDLDFSEQPPLADDLLAPKQHDNNDEENNGTPNTSTVMMNLTSTSLSSINTTTPIRTPLAVAAARASMQTVLQEINDQEQQLQQQLQDGPGTPRILTQDHSRDYLTEDEQHHDQAVSQIQLELGQVTLTPRTRPHHDHAITNTNNNNNTNNITVVDVTPPISPAHHRVPPPSTDLLSLTALAATDDLSRDTGPVPAVLPRTHPARDRDLRNDNDDDDDDDDDERIFDDENELNYGPVVDHTPRRMPGSGRRRRRREEDSVAVQVPVPAMLRPNGGAGAGVEEEEEGWEEDVDDEGVDDDDDDDDADETLGSTLGSTGVSAILEVPPVSLPVAAVVDHTPTDASMIRAHRELKRALPDASMGVLASEASSSPSHDNVEPEDDLLHVTDFGPVVDHTPRSEDVTVAKSVTTRSVANSMAVTAPLLEEDFRADDAMDETTCFGGSTIDGNNTLDAGGWDEEEEDFQVDDDDDDDDEEEEEDEDEEEAVTRGSGSIGDISADGPRSAGRGRRKKGGKVVVVRGPRIKFSSPENRDDNVVDHTPSEMAPSSGFSVGTKDPSLAVLATEDDLAADTGVTSGEDAVYDDENEIEFGPVVDHTPSTPAHHVQSAISTTNSLEVHAAELEEEFREDDAMDETAHGDSTIGDTTWNRDDPTIEDDETAPTKAVTLLVDGKVVASANGEGGLTMVDHTPSDMMGDSVLSPKVTDPSVDVLPSAASSSKADGDHDSQGEFDLNYGPVVDQTPPTPVQSIGTLRADSVVVQAHDLDTVDETYPFDDDTATAPWEGGTRAVEGDDDDDNNNAGAEEEDQVVDFVPARPESRFCDASTLVAADPSEYMSEVDVDDMAHEDNFGPVVDLTPPTRAFMAGVGIPSAAGSTAAESTAVFAPPSVVADDLDPDADEVVEQAGWEGNGPLVEEAPNPQSGNDEPVPPRVNEQLVDFLPPENEVPVVLRGTEEASELTVGGAQSLLQPLDPKEDDFGPVVDQTPTMRSSVAASGMSEASTATQLSLTEARALVKEDDAEGASDDVEQAKGKVVVDHLPSQMRFKRPVDSNCSIGESQLAEDEEEEDDSKFGPVVDHLPTPRASLAPSRGGSTVDALATVSEVNSVDDGADGWDDDVDIDVSESGVSDGTALQTAAATRLAFRRAATSTAADSTAGGASASEHERSVSVRFEDNVSYPRTFARMDQAQYYDPESCASEMKFYDSNAGRIGWSGTAVEMGESSSPAFDDKKPETSFSEADTPPSTPYRRASGEEQPRRLEEQAEDEVRCESCFNCSTSDCPCIRRLLANAADSELVGTLMTPEGESVKIDFRKLTQDEITKRLLLDKEASALRLKLESSKVEGSALSFKVKKLESDVSALQSSKGDLERINVDMQREREALVREKMQVKDELNVSLQALQEAERRVAELTAREAGLLTEIQLLKDALNNSAGQHSTEAELARKLASLQQDLAEKSRECEELKMQTARLEERVEEADLKRCEYSQELESLRMKFEQTSKQYDELRENARQQASERRLLEQAQDELNSRLAVLQNAKDEAEKSVLELQHQHEAELQRQYSLIDKKTEELRGFESSVHALECEKSKLLLEVSKQRSFAEKSGSLADELLSVVKERDLLQESWAESKDAVTSLQQHIDKCSRDVAPMDFVRDGEVETLKADVIEAKTALAAKSMEIESLLQKIDTLSDERESLQQKLATSQSTCQSLDADFQSAKVELEQERTNVMEAQKTIESLQSQLLQTQNDLDRTEAEKKKSTTHLAALGRKLEKVEASSKAFEEKIRDLESKLLAGHESLTSAEAEKQKLLAEIERLGSQYGDVKTKSEQLKREAETRYETLRRETDLALSSLSEEKRAALAELAEVKERNNILADERDELVSKCDEVEKRSVAALQASQKNLDDLRRKYEIDISGFHAIEQTLQDELAGLRKQITSLASERDELLAKCETIEANAEERVKSIGSRSAELAHQHQNEINALKSRLQEAEGATRLLESASKDLENSRQQLLQTIKEKDLLSEENEEMLVQFGLLKEQMDLTEEQVVNLQAELEAQQLAAGEASEHQQKILTLCQENSSLSKELEKIASQRESLQLQIQSLEVEKESMRSQITVLESRCANYVAESDDSQERSRSAFAKLEAQCSELQELCRKREEEIRQLSDGLDHSQSELNELSFLRDKVQKLESECATKGAEIEALQARLETTQSEVTNLGQQIDVLNQTVDARDAGIAELQGKCDSAAEQLNLAKDQLQAAEATIKAEENLVLFGSAIHDLEMNNDAKKVSDIISDYAARMKELEHELNAKTRLVSTLEASVSELQFQLDSGMSSTSLPMASMPPAESISEKDDEIENLKKQVESLNGALHSTRSRLASKEEDLDRLNAELSRLHSEQAAASTTILQPETSNDTAEEMDNLRANIISLAMALERSENMRAEAYARLLKEREANADSLRRLSDSVKRFYSAVSYTHT